MKNFTKILMLAAASVGVSLGASADDETWTSIGSGSYRDNFVHTYYFIENYPEVEVEIQESEQTPGRYRVVNPYVNYPDAIGGGVLEGDHYIVIDASDPDHVYIEESNTGYIIGRGQELAIWSKADDYYNNKYGNWEQAEKDNICGTLRDGHITFPKMSLLTYLREYEEPDYEDKIYMSSNPAGMFRVKLPGAPDLDVSLECVGVDEPHENVIYSVTLGESLEKALLAVADGQWSESVAAGIKDGSVKSVEIDKSGQVKFPYTGDGIRTLYVVTYYDGKPNADEYLTHEINVDESEWRKCGTATFFEGIFSSNEVTAWGFDIDPVEITVEVQESTAEPGRIRLVNAYGTGYPYCGAGNWDSSSNHYIIINGTDPDRVYIEYCESIGLDYGYGVCEVWSRAGRSIENGEPMEKIDADGTFGKYSDNTFTFPRESLMVRFINVRPDTWYWANLDGRTTLKLAPGQIQGGTGVGTVAADVQGERRIFSLDGTEVMTDSPAPGIYVVVENGRSRKVVVR